MAEPRVLYGICDVSTNVQGSIKNLGVGASTDVIFDMGDGWGCYSFVQIFINSGNNVNKYSAVAFGQDDKIGNDNRPLCNINVGGLGVAFGMGNISTSFNSSLFRPAGRFVRLYVTNKDTSALASNAEVSFFAYS